MRSFGLLMIGFAMLPRLAAGHGKGHENLEVLPKHLPEKDLEGGMKTFSKGLGVKCGACHVKGKFDLDDKKPKVAARAFFDRVLHAANEADKTAALAELLAALELKQAKDEKLVWSAFDRWREREHH